MKQSKLFFVRQFKIETIQNLNFKHIAEIYSYAVHKTELGTR